MEHRWGHRIAVDLPVRLVLSPGVVIWGRIRDISMTGAFVHSMQPLSPGALVSIEPPSGIDDRLPSALDATVVWTRDGGAGLEWCDPRDSAPWTPAEVDSAPAWGMSMGDRRTEHACRS